MDGPDRRERLIAEKRAEILVTTFDIMAASARDLRLPLPPSRYVDGEIVAISL